MSGDLLKSIGNLPKSGENLPKSTGNLLKSAHNLSRILPHLPGIFANLTESFANLSEKPQPLTQPRENSPCFSRNLLRVNPSFQPAALQWRHPCFRWEIMIKLNTGFGDYSADDLAHLGETVATKLPTIAIFATLTPTPTQISTAATALRAALAMVGSGRRQAIDAAFQALADLLGDVATNAPQVVGVDDTDLAEIGLPIAKKPARTTTVPDACPNLVLKHGPMPGEVRARCRPPKGNIRTYDIEWTLDPTGTDWTDGGTFPNSRAFKLENLPRGKDVWVRVRARNTVGAGPWSDPATIMVI